jgi:multidrug efflux system membrane fusion protein
MSNYSTEQEPARSPAVTHPIRPIAPVAPVPGADAGRKKRKFPTLWVVLAAVILLVAYIWRQTHAAVPGARTMPGAGRRSTRSFGMFGPLPVVALPAVKGDLNVYLNGLGTVTPLANVTVRTQISGILMQVNFKEGQMVNKGDLLAVIDPRPYQVALEQASGQLQQAQAQLKEAQVDLGRYETLAQQDSIAKQQVDSQRALVSQYQGLVVTDQAAIDSAKLNLTYCHIVAPVTGRVGLRLIDSGNYVTPGDSSGLVVLTEVKPMSVLFTLPEDNVPEVAARIHSGATLTVDAYDRSLTKKLATGTLGTVDNQVDTTTGTFKLRAIFANEDESLFPQQFVNIKMLLDVARGATIISTSAIERGQQGTFVYLVKPDDTVTATPVTLGPVDGERVAVLSGLAVGALVVVDGADKLKEGMQVVVQHQDGTAAPATGAGATAAPWKGAGGAAAGTAPAGTDGTRRRRRPAGAEGAPAGTPPPAPSSEPKN